MENEVAEYELCSKCTSPNSCITAKVCSRGEPYMVKLPKNFWYESPPWSSSLKEVIRHLNLKNKARGL